jgi:3',5'-cyclic-nucleotide phosphodiesterase
MEQDLGIPSALYAAPVSEIIELGNSQIGFINMFAIPLFTGVTDVMPAMRFCVEELERNKATWEEKIALEQEKVKQENGLLGLPDSVRLADGMRSPRTMSVAQPADGDDQPSTVGTASKSTDALNLRIKAVMGSGIPGAHHNSVDESPKGTKQGSPVRSNSRSSHNETNFTKGPWQSSIDRRSSKPRQLQLSYATASAPQLLDHPSQDVKVLANGERQVNGVHTQPSLVTDLVVVDPPTPKESSLQIPDPQRSSDTTTEGSNSAGDWTSQEASATTSKMPISPSTQATSFASEDSAERTIQTPTFNSPLANSTSRSSIGHSTGDGSATTEGQSDLKVLAEGRNLKKKPSRFRMKDLHFWKRSKSGSPPMPAGAPDRRGFGASDESGG